MSDLINTGTDARMSIREIADLVESRHDKVKQSIERLAARGVIAVTPLGEYLDTLGRPAEEYRVSKRDSYIVVAQLSPEFTARLVDRLHELESKAATRFPATHRPTQINPTSAKIVSTLPFCNFAKW